MEHFIYELINKTKIKNRKLKVIIASILTTALPIVLAVMVGIVILSVITVAIKYPLVLLLIIFGIFSPLIHKEIKRQYDNADNNISLDDSEDKK